MLRLRLLPCTLTALALAGCSDDARPQTDDTNSTPATTTLTTLGSTGTTDVTTSGTTTSETPTTSDSSGGGGGDGGEGDQCTVTADCKDGLVCAGGECAPTDGECSGDDDCSGDTYCCADGCLPPGESGGQCIPYGFDPKGWSNDQCIGDVAIGLFEPAVQCEWTAPPDGDPFPAHKSVLTTPLIFDLPHGPGNETPRAEIVIVTYNCSDGGNPAGWGSDPACWGVIRILDGSTCAQLETIDDPLNRIVAASPPAIGDLDGDGLPEIVTHRAEVGTVAFGWDGTKYVTKWVALDSGLGGTTRWDGPSLHDLDDDGIAEVITGGEVFDGLTGTRLNPGQSVPGVTGGGAGRISVVGDLDADGTAELIGAGVWRWNIANDVWEMAYPGDPDGGSHYGFADFGTPGPDPASFNGKQLDGRAEIVSVTGGVVELYTLEGQLIFVGQTDLGSGGPPTIGDFDNDGFPEIASAGGKAFSIFDLDCAQAGPGCIGPWIRWTQPSQDASSQNTGSSIFDFEGDGAAEAVYADECFLRVYEGSTGEVLYSAFRTSCTWYENPVIGDPDYDQNTEVLVGSNDNCGVVCPDIDPIHRGVRCETGEQCAAPFICDSGFCRCETNDQCLEGHVCADPIADTPGAGKVCRAYHPPGVGLTGLRVLRDSLDRWASSRPLWNQHAYSVTNIEDDGTVPKTSAWPPNYTQPDLNNYRQNRQGDVPPAALPDITGKLGDQSCESQQGKVILTSTVCNRGLKAVGANLPATFYLGDPAAGVVLCVAYTSEPVPVQECREVSCEIDKSVNGVVTVVVDDDGQGGQVALECFENNNSDKLEILNCDPIG